MTRRKLRPATRTKIVKILSIRNGFAYGKGGLFYLDELPPVHVGETWEITTEGRKILSAKQVKESEK